MSVLERGLQVDPYFEKIDKGFSKFLNIPKTILCVPKELFYKCIKF
jgi:hypothetical protein